VTIFLFLIKDVTSKNTALNLDNESLSSSEIWVTLIKLKHFNKNFLLIWLWSLPYLFP